MMDKITKNYTKENVRIDNLLIKRLSYLERIDELTEKHSKKIGYPVPNVSGWEIGDDYKDLMLRYFDYSKYSYFNPIDYFYSYNLSYKFRQKLIKRLGGKASSKVLLTNNNTVSLINVVNFIANVCHDGLGVLLPCYFTVPNLLKDRRLKYEKFTFHRSENGYALPKDEIIKSKCQALIITVPVFSTGIYLSDNDIDFLHEFLSHGNYIISDESLTAPNKELIRSLGDSPNFIGIYSPHKFIHFNSFKFSCIIFDSRFEDFFDQWNDVYSGSLNVTNIAAIHHFLSDDYEVIINRFFEFTDKKRKHICDLLSNFNKFETDKGAIGDFQCIYAKDIAYGLGNNINFIKRVVQNTNAVFYPGTLHGFQEEHGFTFRVNLVSYTEQVQNALLKILYYLSDDNNLII